ncbi:MAG: hypothetical protein M3A24_03635 [Candidatus Rhabdochlamydia oedothoracis]|nr:hypothetical protein [Candidatus Rhabdochlamydia oedothoracis]
MLKPCHKPSNNSAFKVSTSSLSEKTYSSERVCRDLKDLFKPFISH